MNEPTKLSLLSTPSIPMNPVSTHLVTNTNFVPGDLRSPNVPKTLGNPRFDVKEVGRSCSL